MYAALDQSQQATLLVSWCWLRFFWRSTHIRAPKLPLYALLCGSPLDSHDHPNIGTPRQGPRSHWSLHLLLALSRYRLTDWTLLPSTAFNHVSMCSQSCANQTHLNTSCCWQYYDVLSHVFLMVSRYRWSGSHPGFMLRFWRDHRLPVRKLASFHNWTSQGCNRKRVRAGHTHTGIICWNICRWALRIVLKAIFNSALSVCVRQELLKDFSVSKDGSKAHTLGDTTWNNSGLKYVLGYGELAFHW